MNDSSAEIYDGYHIQGGLADRRHGAQAGRPGTKVQIEPMKRPGAAGRPAAAAADSGRTDDDGASKAPAPVNERNHNQVWLEVVGMANELPWERLPLRRVPTQKRSRDKVSRALVAADALVREEGPEAINLPRVAERAGVSVGALYQYLPDRESIVGALVWRYHARLEALLEGAVASARREPPSGDPVEYALESVVEIYREEEAARPLRSFGSSPELQAQRQAHRARMTSKVAELMQAAGTRPEDRDTTSIMAQVAFVAADAVIQDTFNYPEDERPERLRELGRLLHSYLKLIPRA